MASHFFGDCVGDLLDKATSGCAFGEPVTYYPKKATGGFKIQAIFDGPFEQVDPDTEVLVASNQYTLGVKLADLPFPPCKGDRVSVRSVSYLVVDSQEDGQGGSEMILHRQC